MDDWKLILYPQVNKARLYNISEDPFERNDLAGNTKPAPRVKRLFARLLALQKQMGDKVDLKAAFPEL